MKRTILGFAFGLALVAIGIPARADTFSVLGSVQDAFAGPAEGASVTICEYGKPGGFTETKIVPADGFVAVLIPYAPSAVAFEVEGDPVYEDVHVVIAQPTCPVSPCNPNQSAVFELRLQRRPTLPPPAYRFRAPAPAR